MKVIVPILTSLIVGLLGSAIAILSMQNATQIPLKFFNQQSVPLPIGLILAFSFSIGAIGGSILLPLLFSKDSQKEQPSHQNGEF